MGKDWMSFQLAAVYVGTVVGAGFATGREIVEFFTQYGVFGLAGILIVGLLFILGGTKMMIISARIHATSYQELNRFLFGETIGKIVNIFMLVVLLLVTSIMMSGAGSIFEEHLGLSKQFGILITVVLTLLVMVFGVKGLFSVNIVVVPMLIFFTLIIAIHSLRDGTFFGMSTTSSHASSWVLSAFSYASFNLTLAAAVLVPVATEIKDERIIKRGGIQGGALLTVILFGSHIALSSLPNVTSFDIPMAEIMRTTFFAFYFLYVLVIYGEVFTSIIGNTFGLERQLSSLITLSKMRVILIILFIAVFISQIGYSTLLTFLYPLFGKICLVVLVLLVVKKIPKM